MFEFTKYEALGNDYIIIDPNQYDVPMTADIVRRICDRHLGVGSDGILYGPFIEGDRIRLRIFNPDGSECEKSGNGLRIFARYVYESKYVKSQTFSIHTRAGEVVANILEPKEGLIKVLMGSYTFQSEQLPMVGAPREVIQEPIELDGETLRVTCVSVGNPHCVVPLEEISRDKAFQLGPRLASHALFPQKTNVQLMKVLDSHNIQIEIWERGAGYTLASGSSSCAAACAAHRLGLVQSPVTVHMPGGRLEIEIDRDGRISMTGTARSVAQGVFTPEFKARLRG
ncbi:diaminopimelate epimerase [Archangium gephyra]|nr:diaminopimelate epimerase [Archangium gephyra]